MLAKSVLRRMTNEERSHVQTGALIMTVLTGAVSYFNYREYIKKDFLRSEGHYRFNSKIENVTPWKNMYFTWYRMPEEEFNVYHRFKPYYIIGQIDYSKEVLIPKVKYIDGVACRGYQVVNPVYCYEGGKFSFKNLFAKTDPVIIDRAAVIIDRGWIPAHLKDKRSRPNEVDTRKLVKIRGVWRKGKDIHQYKKPNNPDNNEWYNLCLEDIGIYWDLPNFDECKHYYFEVCDLGNGEPATTEDNRGEFPLPSNPDQVIDDHYGWKVKAATNKGVYQVFGAIAAASLGLAFIA